MKYNINWDVLSIGKEQILIQVDNNQLFTAIRNLPKKSKHKIKGPFGNASQQQFNQSTNRRQLG